MSIIWLPVSGDTAFEEIFPLIRVCFGV